jgi:anhydro-N-acetylmuramic acid kinase
MNATKTTQRYGSSSDSILVLGIMSGTSIDSVDYALCAVSDERVVLRKLWQTEFPKALQKRLQEAAQGFCSSHEAAQLHHELGRLYADQAQRGLGQARPDLVGLHGQTIFHRAERKNPATFQLGEPAYLSEKLRVPVVNNFRAADLAAGGEGAPLATIFHKVIFGVRGLHVCVHNLGGISNVTSIDWRKGKEASMVAFDTGPANMLMDLSVQRLTKGRKRFDNGGAWASRGVVSEDLLDGWLRHPYFFREPPKSTGRELFGEAFLEPALQLTGKRRISNFDVLATFTEFTARSIALNYRLHLRSVPDKVVLAGGGAANSFLVERIRVQFADHAFAGAATGKLNSRVQVLTSQECGWPIQSLEAAAFALLAYYRVKKRPGNIPSTTGAARPVLLGQISEP